MNRSSRTTKKHSLVIRIMVIAFLLFTVFKILQLQMQMNQKQDTISDLKNNIAVAQLINEDLTEKCNNYNLEQRAREEGYVLPYDQVYQISN